MASPIFDGSTYDPARDGERLGSAMERIRVAMTSPAGRWWTLAELAIVGRCSEAAASARVRDLRKARHGKLEVAREHVAGGVWRYRVIPSDGRQARLPW